LFIEPYSFGVGDRFAHQASAQLKAFQMLESRGVTVVPVWNKSNREHTFIQSHPESVWLSAEQAVKSLQWRHAWYVDADHIQIQTVDRFLPHSNFFTIDVASFISQPVTEAEASEFARQYSSILGPHSISTKTQIKIAQQDLESVARQYLMAIREAGRIYKHIASQKGEGRFITEVSMDETDEPQSPTQLLIILAALAKEGVPLQTIAPKFSGRFNKGVDYVGDLGNFENEFRSDVAVLQYAAQHFGLPANLKLSVHSGSDKFSLYPIIRKVLQESGTGIHVKTAGTTWLEEIIGLAEAGGEGLELAKEIYAEAVDHADELCAPYASVIDIQRDRLPSSTEVAGWSGSRFASAIRHIPGHADFNSNMRQLLHVAFKLAAHKGTRFTDLLVAHRAIVADQVTTNLFDRHLQPLFLG
jgi:hypothetical protein